VKKCRNLQKNIRNLNLSANFTAHRLTKPLGYLFHTAGTAKQKHKLCKGCLGCNVPSTEDACLFQTNRGFV